MNFLDYPLSFDEEIYSPNILRTRREQLGFSQQDVADGARMQLRQYQRLESGERTIEGATMKTALAVCAVLKLNPFIFFREAESMNRYRELIPRDSDAIMEKEETIPLFVQKACDLYNEQCHTSYSPDNIKVAFCTMDNIAEVYRSFTKQYGFHSEKRTKKDFESMLAEAFVGQTDIDDPKHVDGLLIRTDPPEELDSPDYYMIMIVHELAHIFCTTHEIPTAGKAGQRFYDLYCEDIPGTPAKEYNNGYMNAGYAIWREFIADIIGDGCGRSNVSLVIKIAAYIICKSISGVVACVETVENHFGKNLLLSGEIGVVIEIACECGDAYHKHHGNSDNNRNCLFHNLNKPFHFLLGNDPLYTLVL